MDLKRRLPWLLVGLTACIGPGVPDCDTATGLGCEEPDADTDVDADTDADGHTFDPWLFTVEMHSGYDGEHLVPYFIEGTEIAPYVIVRIYDDKFRDEQLDLYVCEWSGRLVEVSESSLGLTNIWQGYRVRFEHLPDATRNDCDNFPTGQWTDGSPTEALEALDFSFGWAPISAGMSSDLEAAYINAGYDWNEVAPYIFGVYWSAPERTAGGTAQTTEEMGYGFARPIDEDGNLAYDEDGEAASIEVSGAAEAVAPAIYESYYYYGFEVSTVLRQ